MTGEQILSVPMDENDAGAKTIGEYLVALSRAVIEEGEVFSGKRPFGNSGWEWDLNNALAEAGEVHGRDRVATTKSILSALDALKRLLAGVGDVEVAGAK